MDESVELMKQSLAIYQRDPMQWSLMYGVCTVATIATAGLGIVLAPNAFRATAKAIEEERGPDLQELFNFHDTMMEDAIAVGGMFITSMVAGSFTGPLASLVAILLGLAPIAVTEPTVGGLDALQLSVGFAQKQPIPMFVHGILASLINLPAICCFFPIFFTLPVTAISQSLFYAKHRNEVLGIAPQLLDE